MIKKYIYNQAVKNSITDWKTCHEKTVTAEIKDNNIAQILSSIYAFRSIVELIDFEIAELEKKNKDIVKEIDVDIGGEMITLPVKISGKPQLLLNEWEKLHDYSFSLSEVKDLSLKFIDICKLRIANYRGFILRITQQDFILYKCE